MLTQRWQMRKQWSEEVALLSVTDLYRAQFPPALTSAGLFTGLHQTFPAQDPVTGTSLRYLKHGLFWPKAACMKFSLCQKLILTHLKKPPTRGDPGFFSHADELLQQASSTSSFVCISSHATRALYLFPYLSACCNFTTPCLVSRCFQFNFVFH